MRTLLFLILLFLNHFLHSQVTIYGSVKNEKGEFLSGANVYEINQEKGAPSNENGHYFLELKKEDLKLRISYIGYHTKVIEIPKSKLTQDYKLDFILEAKTEEITGVEVTASPVKKVISEDNLNILDFEFLGDSLLLIQESTDLGYFIEIKSEFASNGLRQKLSFRPKSLELDCFGNIQIRGKDSVYQMAFQDQYFYLVDQFSKTDYDKLIAPCLTQNNTYYVFKENGEHGKSIQYTLFPKDTAKEPEKLEIVDLDGWKVAAQYYIEIIALYNASVSYGDNVIYGGIWDGDVKKLNESPKLNQMIVFYDKILSQPLYSPIFNFHDALILFDHTNNRIRYLNSKNEIPITYHESRKWVDLILFDKNNQIFVTFFKNKGLYTAHSINTQTGKLENGIILEENAYPENLKIKNGFIYYLHRDPNDFYKNRLLKQKVISN
ncbi:MAG: carboxypeptidase-like regulatory domain-containing protein [Crocinitomicaceae bacterium]|nr:carboxypeptidase-like regulatory domain-containing protein [Crocinitomicaceae bacterium]